MPRAGHRRERQAKQIESGKREAGKHMPAAERIARAAVDNRNGERKPSHESLRHGNHH